MLNYQTPAEGISLEKEWGSSKMYRISCDCGDKSHDITLDIEVDKFGINIKHYVNVETSWWDEPTKFYWLNSIIHRCKITWEVWTKGKINLEATTILTEQSALNYSETIKKAIEDYNDLKKI
jgi:hypothetical protein